MENKNIITAPAGEATAAAEAAKTAEALTKASEAAAKTEAAKKTAEHLAAKRAARIEAKVEAAKTEAAKKTAADLAKASEAALAKLQKAVKQSAPIAEVLALKKSADEAAAAYCKKAVAEKLTALCASADPVKTMTAFMSDRLFTIPNGTVKEVTDKETRQITGYKAEDKTTELSFEALDRVFAQVTEHKTLASKANFAKYCDLYRYRAVSFHRVKDDEMDWSIPNMTAAAAEVFSAEATAEKGKKNADKPWTGSVCRDNFDKMTNALLTTVFPAGYDLPKLRAEDRRWLFDSVISTKTDKGGNGAYATIETSTLLKNIFAAVQTAAADMQYKVEGNSKATYDGGLSAKAEAAKKTA